MPPTAGASSRVYPLLGPSDTEEQAHIQSLIGIAVAVGGNIVISLALNCQKLAHKRLELQKQRERELNTERQQNGDAEQDNGGLSLANIAAGPAPDETHPLIRDRRDSYDSYTILYKNHPKPKLVIPGDATSPRWRSGLANSPTTAIPRGEDVRAVAIEITGDEEDESAAAKNASEEIIGEGNNKHNETDYLRSKLWWFGLFLMNVGEFGNFLSYAYAPASVVAPLGTVALISNCFFAPLMLKEKLRKRDFLGVTLAIFGAVTIVGAAKTSDVRLDPNGIIRAISRRPFVVYAIICTVLIVVFGVLSAGPAGQKWVFVDVGLCALFGGFTVLATKAVSTLLSLHWIVIFKDWITYPIVAVLVVTGIGQIKYLNRALMKFDSKVVIPTFFVSFNLSAIVGSAILYGDFENVEVHRFITFLYGCATTFAGVFFLTQSTGDTGVVLEETVVWPEGAEASGEPNGGVTRPMVLSSSQSRGVPVLQGKQSSASLALSAGQYLLLATSPPRGSSADRSTPTLRSNAGSPASVSRRGMITR